MKKKLLVIIMTVTVIVLVACGTTDKPKQEATGKSPEEFMVLTEKYLEKQQALMMKQLEGEAGDFATVSQHAQDVVASTEYKEWEKEVEKMKKFKIKKNAESEKYTELQEALNDYGKIQTEHFQAVAKAKDEEEYNEVTTKSAEKIVEMQEKFIKILETIEE